MARPVALALVGGVRDSDEYDNFRHPCYCRVQLMGAIRGI